MSFRLAISQRVVENQAYAENMTSLLAGLIAAGHPVRGLPCSGGWCEIDDARDLAVAEVVLAEGKRGAAPDRPRLAEIG